MQLAAKEQAAAAWLGRAHQKAGRKRERHLLFWPPLGERRKCARPDSPLSRPQRRSQGPAPAGRRANCAITFAQIAPAEQQVIYLRGERASGRRLVRTALPLWPRAPWTSGRRSRIARGPTASQWKKCAKRGAIYWPPLASLCACRNSSREAQLAPTRASQGAGERAQLLREPRKRRLAGLMMRVCHCKRERTGGQAGELAKLVEHFSPAPVDQRH